MEVTTTRHVECPKCVLTRLLVITEVNDGNRETHVAEVVRKVWKVLFETLVDLDHVLTVRVVAKQYWKHAWTFPRNGEVDICRLGILLHVRRYRRFPDVRLPGIFTYTPLLSAPKCVCEG